VYCAVPPSWVANRVARCELREDTQEGFDLTEREVTILLADFATVWNELFPAEQARIVQLSASPPCSTQPSVGALSTLLDIPRYMHSMKIAAFTSRIFRIRPS
jgi:hypothetical protein